MKNLTQNMARIVDATLSAATDCMRVARATDLNFFFGSGEIDAPACAKFYCYFD